MRTENRTHITAGNICKNTQQFTLRKYILIINSIIDIMQYSLTGTGPSSMSTLAPVTTRTMSTVLQEMGDLCSIISAVLPYFRTTSSKTYLYPATPPPPPRIILLLQLTTSQSQPSATIRSFWHTPSKCPPETQDQRGCLSQYKKKDRHISPQPAPYVAPVQPSYVEPAPYQVGFWDVAIITFTIPTSLSIMTPSLLSRLQATASHRKPLQRLARSRKISKPQPQPPKIPNPVSSEDCDLLFLEHSPHQAEMACIYIFITNPYNG